MLKLSEPWSAREGADMENPTPVRRFLRDRWIWWLDLRHPWGLRQYVVPVQPVQASFAADSDDPTFPAAIHASWRILESRRRDAEVASAQLSLLESSDPTDQVAAAWLADYTADQGCEPDAYHMVWELRSFRDRFKGTPVRAFSGEPGKALLRQWRDELAEAGQSPKTRRNKLGIAMQVLRFARKHKLLSELPEKPLACLAGETLASPRQPTVAEADVRSMMAHLFSGLDKLSAAGLYTPQERECYASDRQLYVSLGFYWGMRVIDLDHILVDDVSHDFGTFVRRSTKNRAEDQVMPMPTQAARDIEAHLRRPGRKWKPGDHLCGGPWLHPARVLTSAAKRAGVPLPVNFRSVLRRSTVRELALRGWSERDCADYLGHADTAMIHTVYLQTPGRRASRKIPWDPDATRAELGYETTARASVLRILETVAPTPHKTGLQVHRGGRRDED